MERDESGLDGECEVSAQAQADIKHFRDALAAEQLVSDKLEKALLVAKAFCDGLTAEECPDTVAIPINAALSEVAAIRAKQGGES